MFWNEDHVSLHYKEEVMTNTNTDFNTQIVPQENVVQHCEVITQSL